MAKYTNVKTTGVIEWAKIFENNRDKEGYQNQYKDCDGAYTVNQIISKEDYKALTDAGSKKKPNQKRLMDGEIVIKHERKHSVPQAPQAGGQPEVKDKYGRPWDVNNYGYPANGSVAEIESLITEFEWNDNGVQKTTSRTTMKSIKILEFKKWNAETKEIEDGFIPPMDSVKKSEPVKPVKEVKQVEEEEDFIPDDDLDDEIPF